MKILIWPSDLDVSILDDKLETIWIAQSLQDGFWYVYRRIKMRDHHSEKQGIGHLT